MKPSPAAQLITHARLLEIVHYDPLTGVFTWKANRRSGRVGERCGWIGAFGYWRLCLDNREYSAARVAWFYMTGSWPHEETDHINRVRSDDRFANLREATRSQNGANCRGRREGLKGAYFHRTKKKWKAQIGICGKHFHIGYFDTEREAHEAFVNASRKLRGEFARAA
jgi:hypothetical protein